MRQTACGGRRDDSEPCGRQRGSCAVQLHGDKGQGVLLGGGAKSALWRRIVANVIGVPVETVATEKGPAYGAALLAMTGCGEYAGVKEACEACVRVSGVTEPEADLREVYDRLYVIYDSIYPAMKKIFADMRGV